MKQLELFDKKQKMMLAVFLIFVIFIIIFYFYTKYQEYQEAEIISEEWEQEEIGQTNLSYAEETEQFIIHISGAVVKEGIVTIKQGARISDVIEAAGGLQENASLKNVNLAYMVEDGQKIYIPTKEEEESQEEKEYTIVQEGNHSSDDEKEEEKTKVNINKATQTELEELPGIGSATALKIIQYREENGTFHSIEEIKNVNGIGDAKFDQLKEYITI